MRLSKTNAGNWARHSTITGGGKWRFVANCASAEQAESVASAQRDKGRKIKIEQRGPEKWRVEAYIARHREVMIHATVAQCAAAGVRPGPCNLPPH